VATGSQSRSITAKRIIIITDNKKKKNKEEKYGRAKPCTVDIPMTLKQQISIK
jgi:hypothetical protein